MLEWQYYLTKKNDPDFFLYSQSTTWEPFGVLDVPLKAREIWELQVE